MKIHEYQAKELLRGFVSASAAYNSGQAGIAQLVEQLICNHQVVGSTPTAGTTV